MKVLRIRSNKRKNPKQGILKRERPLGAEAERQCWLLETRAYGPSMVPTFNLTGDMFLAEQLSIKFGKVSPGDIVLLRSPESSRKVMVKRLLGLESHSVTYVVDPMKSDRCDTIVVPKGHVWVEGDNIYNSRDSRQFGPVPYGLLEGKVFCKIWPPKEFGSLMKSGMKDPDL